MQEVGTTANRRACSVIVSAWIGGASLVLANPKSGHPKIVPNEGSPLAGHARQAQAFGIFKEGEIGLHAVTDGTGRPRHSLCSWATERSRGGLTKAHFSWGLFRESQTNPDETAT